MGNSKVPGSQGSHTFQLQCSAETPGPLGVADYSSGERACVAGDSPGPLGFYDLAASQDVCVEPGSDPAAATGRAEQDDEGHDVYVFSLARLVEWAKKPGEVGFSVGTVMDAATLVELFSEFGLAGLARDLKAGQVSYYVKTYKGSQYVIFKGYPGLRRTLTSTRYMAQNTKVVNMAIGRAGVVKSGLKGGAWSFVFVAAIEIAEYCLSDKETLSDLGVDLFSGLAKTAIATAASIAVGAALAASGMVIVPIAAAIAVGVAVSFGLEWVDTRLGLTKRLKRWVAQELSQMRRDYDNAKYEAERTWNFLNTPSGIEWLMRRLGGY